MTDDELRAIVRDVIARTRSGSTAHPRQAAPEPFAAARQHASHGLFVLPAGMESDGPCLIEPAVPCNHCGYCKSYGH